MEIKPRTAGSCVAMPLGTIAFCFWFIDDNCPKLIRVGCVLKGIFDYCNCQQLRLASLLGH